MRISSLIIASISIVVTAALLSACAGTARGSKSSVFQNYKEVEVIDYSLSKADALVVIRYPAIIHADAEEPYFHAFSMNAIGGEVPPANRTKKVTTRIAQSVIAKSNYYVMSLYRELQRELPENTVLLSPHIILWDRDRGLYSRPILAAEQIPSVVTVDFNVYSYPDTNELMDSPPVTFGDLVTPLFVVQGDRWLQPPTNGLLLASDPMLQTAWGLSRKQAESEIESMLLDSPHTVQRPLDFVAFLNRRSVRNRNLPLKSVGESRLEVAAVEDYPVEKIRMDGALLQNLAEDFAQDPFSESFVKGAATRVRRTLNEVNNDRATFFARQTALARFDPELAVAFLARSGGESVRTRLQLAEALIAISIYDGTYLGDYGSKMRQMIEGEYRLLENRRTAARKANVTTSVAALALIGSVYALTASGAIGGIALQSFGGVLVLGSLWAMSSTLETRAESAQMSEHFLALIAPALERQISVQMEWLESKERISAMGFAEFRNKTLTLYQSRVRSLEQQYDDDCIFDYPGYNESGRWYGSCRRGFAHDRGYGVIRDEAGNSLEYLGSAAGGMPSGTGGMITRNSGEVGALYFEGSFKQGLPNGVVQVEAPGVRPRIREFRAGKDVGSGAADKLKSLTF